MTQVVITIGIVADLLHGLKIVLKAIHQPPDVLLSYTCHTILSGGCHERNEE